MDSDTFFNLLSKYTILSEKGELISSTCSVWHTISQELEGKLNPKSVYIKVLKDSNEVLTKLRKNNGFDVTAANNLSSTESNDSNDELSSSSYHEPGKTIFKLRIPYDMYRQFYPKKVIYQRNNKKRVYDVLKQGTWTDIINDEFVKVHKLPCNFIYKRAKVYNPCNSQHFIKFEAKCKDDVCGAEMIGWSDHKPSEGEPLELHISTVDTRVLERKHTTKRPLKGEKRIRVGLELDKDLACNWRRNNVSDLEYGRISPPNLYQLETLRKVKQEGKDKRLGINYNCPIQSLIEFKHNSSYSGSIHSIGIDPFYVHYWTNHQISIYKDICKGYCKLSVDASGGFTKKLKRTSLGLLSASIFLYEGIVSTPFGHISVTQMVSEKHDTLSIFQWLAVWMSTAIRPPNEVVCDYSRALLAAISRSFCNGIGLNDYVNYAFRLLIGIETKIPATYIRLDVAHMVKIFCRIKCLT